MSAARRYLIAGLVIGLTLIVSAIIIRATDSNDSGSTGQAVAETENEAEAEAEAEEEGGPRAGIEEAQEEAEVTASRLEALHAAQAAGKFGSKVAATTSPPIDTATDQVGKPPLKTTSGLIPKNFGSHSTMSASLPTSSEPTSWSIP